MTREQVEAFRTNDKYWWFGVVYICKEDPRFIIRNRWFFALTWKIEKSNQLNKPSRNLTLIRLAVLPLASYLLLTTTVHPWYVTLFIPLLPFLISNEIETLHFTSFLYPLIYFSLVVVLSYLTYLDPNNFREYAWVRLVEYIPLYIMLIWAFFSVMIAGKKVQFNQSQ